MSVPLLEVEALGVHYAVPGGRVRALDDVSFALDRREMVGIFGESGSGKTSLAFALLGLVEPPGRVVAGRVTLAGRAPDVVTNGRNPRGGRIAYLGPDPRAALDPHMRIGVQLLEALAAHVSLPRPAARERVRATLQRAGIAFPEDVLQAYPGALPAVLSQRVALALALLPEPDCVIADDPARPLELAAHGPLVHDIATAAREIGAAMLWLVRDPAVIAGSVTRLAILYAGRIVEQGRYEDVLRQPAHPFTRGLVDALPGRAGRGVRLKPNPGAPPDPRAPSSGCAFRARCGHAMRACVAAPALVVLGLPGDGRAVRCHNPLLKPGVLA